MEHKSFNNSEDELLHFVGLFSNQSFEWKEQYDDDITAQNADEDIEHRMAYFFCFSFIIS